MSNTSTSCKRLVKSKSGLRIIPANENERSPFELAEPEWIPDEDSPVCMECEEKFDFLKRRHHCRRCGRVCCAGCCNARLALPRMCFLDPVRVCSPCAATTTLENRFYHHHLKSLLSGAILTMSSDSRKSEAILSSCRLTPDHRYLQIQQPDVSLNLPIHKLTAMHVSKGRSCSDSDEAIESSGADDATNPGFFETDADRDLNCVVLTYKSGGAEAGLMEEAEVRLSAPSEAAPSAYAFLKALQQAALMAMEARHVIGTGK
ncbi:zinc finger FYVE domain-containing protein 21 [Hyalella azteca]|uniref:Zinc finger FYVE domain-containing protein 21 n=1 Tax=Hyalella azteca TaxID=294128 RepID=A0A8B7PL66_HYAAZ|nr:zinc finger FYVE domain-containing protein 21 [Hyalella azteca]